MRCRKYAIVGKPWIEKSLEYMHSILRAEFPSGQIQGNLYYMLNTRKNDFKCYPGKKMATPSDIAKYFLVDDKNDSGLAQDLVNSGALSRDLLSQPSESSSLEVCTRLYISFYIR